MQLKKNLKSKGIDPRSVRANPAALKQAATEAQVALSDPSAGFTGDDVMNCLAAPDTLGYAPTNSCKRQLGSWAS